MKKFLIKTLAVGLLVGMAFGLLPMHTQPAAALTGTLSIQSMTDVNGNCTEVAVSIDIGDRNATNNDDGTYDYYYAVVFDGNLDVHASRRLRAPFGNTATLENITIDESFGPEVIRPFRVALYDVSVAGTLPIADIIQSPRIAAIDIDPASVLPTCYARPYVPQADQRINKLSIEPWQTAAIYCRVDGRIDIYHVKDGINGYLAISVTRAEVEALGVPAENTLLGQNDNTNVQLWRLNTGEFQLMSSTQYEYLGYSYLFDGCP